MNTRERISEILERIKIKLLESNRFIPYRIGFDLHELEELNITTITFTGFLQFLIKNNFINKFEVLGDSSDYIEGEDNNGLVYAEEYVGYYCLFVDPREFELAYDKYKKITERKPHAQKEIAHITLKPTSGWENVTIKFLDDNNIEIEEDKKFLYSASFKDFGCTDHNKGDVQWKILRDISFGKGSLSVLNTDLNTIKKISNLNGVLMRVFSQSERPINPDPEHPGRYKTAFTIIPIGSLRKAEIRGVKDIEKRFAQRPTEFLKKTDEL